MATGLLLDKRLSVRTLRDSRIVVDEAACTGATFATLLNPDGDGKNYRLGTWLVGGVLAVLASGAAEVLAVGAGGNANASYDGNGGDVVRGTFTLPAGRLPVVVGAALTATASGGASAIGALTTSVASLAYGNDWAVGAGGTAVSVHEGVWSSITGTSLEYGRAAQPGPAANRGWGGYHAPGSDGVVHVRWQI